MHPEIETTILATAYEHGSTTLNESVVPPPAEPTINRRTEAPRPTHTTVPPTDPASVAEQQYERQEPQPVRETPEAGQKPHVLPSPPPNDHETYERDLELDSAGESQPVEPQKRPAGEGDKKNHRAK